MDFQKLLLSFRSPVPFAAGPLPDLKARFRLAAVTLGLQVVYVADLLLRRATGVTQIDPMDGFPNHR